MEFTRLAETRQSTRKFTGEAVDREQLNRCLKAAWLAPSANNSQPWSFVVVDDPKIKEQVTRETYSQLISFNKFATGAGAIVVLVIEKPKLISQIGGSIKKKEFSLIDIGIAAEHFCLQATEEGLGTCILGWFNEAPIKSILHIPNSRTIGLLIAVGHPADSTIREKKRKPWDQFCAFNQYNK